MAANINSLPVETLQTMLSLVRNSSDESETKAFAALQRVDHFWRELVRLILWTDVVLDDKNLGLFLHDGNNPNYTLVRSLTISINPQNHPNTCRPGVGLPESPFKWRGRRQRGSGNKAVWPQLSALVEVLPLMNRLNTFSFTIQRTWDPWEFRQDWLQVGVIKELVEHLPRSCTALEIDTDRLWQQSWGGPHLCEAIRDVLPRLKHLRLSLGQICDHIIVNHLPVNGNEARGFTSGAPMLETLVINLIDRLPNHTVGVQLCGCSCRTGPGPDWRPLLGTRDTTPQCVHETLYEAVNLGLFPKAREIRVLGDEIPGPWQQMGNSYDVRPQGSLRMCLSNDLCSYNYHSNTTVRMPYLQTSDQSAPNVKLPDSDFLRYLDSNGGTKGVFGFWGSLRSLAEGGIWQTTISGSRLPGSYTISSEARDKGYVIQNEGVVDILDKGEALQQKTEYLRAEPSIMPYFTHDTEQPDDGPLGELGKTLAYVRIEDCATRKETWIT